MTIATPTQAYATYLEADQYLSLKDDWLDLDKELKEDALLWARYYIDANFGCEVDMDDIADEVKLANSLLAYDYYNQGDLFFDNDDRVKSKRTHAGSVESETHYFIDSRTKPNSYGKVKSILSGLCTNQNRLTRV